MSDQLYEQTIGQVRKTLRALRAAGMPLAQAVAATVPVLLAAGEALAQLASPVAAGSEAEKRSKP